MTEFPFTGAATHQAAPARVELHLTEVGAAYLSDLLSQLDPQLNDDEAQSDFYRESREEECRRIRERRRAFLAGVQLVDGGWVRAYVQFDSSYRSRRRVEVQFAPGEVLAMSTSHIVSSPPAGISEAEREQWDNYNAQLTARWS